METVLIFFLILYTYAWSTSTRPDGWSIFTDEFSTVRIIIHWIIDDLWWTSAYGIFCGISGKCFRRYNVNCMDDMVDSLHSLWNCHSLVLHGMLHKTLVMSKLTKGVIGYLFSHFSFLCIHYSLRNRLLRLSICLFLVFITDYLRTCINAPHHR